MAAEAPASAASSHAGSRIASASTSAPAPTSASTLPQSGPSAPRQEKPTHDRGGPAWLRACAQSIEGCSRSIAQYTERMEERNRKTRARRRGDDEQDQNTPDPLWKRKGIIVLVFIILSWVYLVYVWRLCAPAIQQRTTTTSPKSQPVRLASRPTGIALLVVFNVLWLTTMWTYVRVILTGPGFVREHVQKEPPPQNLAEKHNAQDQRQWREEGLGGPYLGDGEQQEESAGQESPVIRVVDLTKPVGSAGTTSSSPSRRPRNASTEVLRSPSHSPTRASTQVEQRNQAGDRHSSGDQPDEHPVDPTLPAVVGPIGAGIAAAATVPAPSSSQVASASPPTDAAAPASQPDPAAEESPSTVRDSSAGEASGKPSQSGEEVDPTRTIAPQADAPQTPSWARGQGLPGSSSGQLPEPSRMPPYPDYAPLARANRYCHRCQHVKSLRAHHCRHCGTCVLRMDHHCPWVGGCVGARNHKFFFHFVFWVTILEFYVLISTAVLFSRGVLGKAGYEDWTVDGFLVSLFPICAVFILFTFSLLLTHAYLLMTNQTTIEHLAFSRHTRKEEILLSNYFSKAKSEAKANADAEGAGARRRRRGAGSGLWQFRERKRLKQAWNAEWGELRWEINHWRLDRALDGADEHGGQQSADTPRRWQKLSKPQAALANWKQTMGPKWWMWVLPLGRSMSDGLDYPLNPRHGPEGQWRRRSEWPEELR